MITAGELVIFFAFIWPWSLGVVTLVDLALYAFRGWLWKGV